jgi:hypothetical protein
MYLRTIQWRNKGGSVVRSSRLAHNVRHPTSGQAVAKVLHSEDDPLIVEVGGDLQAHRKVRP